MFTELRIRNYRLFEDLTIKDLKRINLFVGRNNSGKSAAVEAVALVAVPYVPFQLNMERGMKAPTTNEYAFENYLRSFFRGLDASRKLEVTAKHSDYGIRTCRAEIIKSPITSVLAERPTTASIGKLPYQVAFVVRMEEEDDRYLQYQTSLGEEGLALAESGVSTSPPYPLSIEYVPTNPNLGQPVFDRLSELRREKRTKLILDVLRHIEPRLVDVPEVQTIDGVANLFCDIGIGELMPLGLMGQGLARVLRLVLMLESSSQGDITVIDEIENGIHHELMFNVWQAIDEAARRRDKQVFATTHSYECLRSANDAIDSNNLAIHRLEVGGDRTTRCVTLGPEAVEGAISNGFEIR